MQRKTFVEEHGVLQPAPAPRFSRTEATIQRPPSHAGQHTDEVLSEFGFDDDRITKLPRRRRHRLTVTPSGASGPCSGPAVRMGS